MVVDQVNVNDIAAFESKDDPKIARYINSPEPAQVAPQAVEPPSWNSQILGLTRLIETFEYPVDADNVSLRQTAAIVSLVEAPQPAMAEVDDHRRTVRGAQSPATGSRSGSGSRSIRRARFSARFRARARS